MRNKLCESLRLCVRSKNNQRVLSIRMEREQSDQLFCVFCDFCVQPKYAQILVYVENTINVIKQMKQFHLTGTDVRRVRPQSIKISQLNVREIKDDRTSVPAKCTFLQFRKNLFHLYNLLINNYWHTEFTHRKAHTLRCARFAHAKTQRAQREGER